MQHEPLSLSVVADLIDLGKPLDAAQTAALRKHLTERRDNAGDLLAAYRKIRGKTASAEEGQRFADAVARYNTLSTATMPEKGISFPVPLSADQRRALCRKRAADEGLQHQWSDRSDLDGARKEWSGTITGKLDRFNGTMRFSGMTVEETIGRYINEICDGACGQAGKCTVDGKLAKQPLQGEIQFFTLEEGLDRIAKLAGGKLEKDGQGWKIVAR